MDKNKTLNYLKKENFVTSKKLGQNFLVNPTIKKKIVEAANLENVDLIIEIGPGLGAITEIILNTTNKKLLAIELDKRLFAHLTNQFSKNSNFEIINDDVLKINLSQLIQARTNKKAIVIANLPYSISSKIIAKLILCPKISESIVMVQKEMAQRVCAQVNKKGYNAFTAWIGINAKINFLFDVTPNNFVPPPKVMSTVIRISNMTKITSTELLEEYRNFFAKCFNAKRKTLLNNLQNYYDKQQILDILVKLNIDRNIRAESLDSQTLINIYEKILNKS